MTKKTELDSLEPNYQENYDRGWIGFAHSDTNLFSRGIAHFTRADKTSDVTVTHTFVVIGENECVEANQGQGVVRSKLSEMYFERDDCMVVFRKPKGLSESIADAIVETALNHEGENFSYSAVAHQLVHNNFMGWIINKVFGGKPKEFAAHLVRSGDQWVCSELVGYCLQQQPRYENKGVLSNQLVNLTPQLLFEDDELFEPLGESGD